MSESLKQQIARLQEIYESELDPQGRAFVALADAHRRLGDLGQALVIIQEGLEIHPDFASAHVVAGWVHRSREEPDAARRSFERVLELDAENAFARAAIAELIDDQRAQAYREKVAARGAAEQAAREVRPLVPIAFLAPEEPDETVAAPSAALEPVLEDDDRPVVPIPSVAPEGGEEASYSDVPIGGEIYTRTLAELYAGQGATEKAIEVYRKLMADDPDNTALSRRLTELQSLEPGSDGAPAELDVLAGRGTLRTSPGERPTVPIESLAPEGDVGDGALDDSSLR